MNEIFLETERLRLRYMDHADCENIAEMMQDESVMYAWEKIFDDKEVCGWINKNCVRYANDGYGYFIAEDKSSGIAVGQIGILREEIEGESYVGLGYMLKKKYFGQGYAVEGAKGCLQYAFNILHADKVIAEIRPDNTASRRVAEKIGMKVGTSLIKHYDGKDMEHLVYEVHNPLFRQVVLNDLRTVTLRPAAEKDAAGLVEYAEAISQESDNLTFGPGEFGISTEDEKQFLESVASQPNAMYLVAVDKSGRIVGGLNFAGGKRPRVAHTGEFGISVLKDYWGKGLGRQMLDCLIQWCISTGIVRKLNLKVRSDNEQAIYLYKKAGFKEEGRETRGMQVDGIFYDLICMGMEIN